MGSQLMGELGSEVVYVSNVDFFSLQSLAEG